MPDRQTSTTPPSEILRRVAEITARNERLLHRLTAEERRFRKLARAVWKVQEEERRRLARELHDGVGQTMTALINQLRRAQQRGPDAGGDELAEAVKLAALALDDVRELSRLLRPPVLDDLGLHAGLSWLARNLREHTGLEAEIDWQCDTAEPLDAELETLVFRFVQEGLNNVVKHSGQRHAHVSVRRAGGALEIEIVDGGSGFDPAVVLSPDAGSPGLGLRGIRDRIELFGGRLKLEAAPGSGCRLHAVVPKETARP